MVDDAGLTEERIHYIRRLAYRYVRLRRSAAIDEDDLVSAASLRWWQFTVTRLHAFDTVPEEVLFRQQIKFAMRDTIRESEPVKVTRTQRSKLKAYEMPYSVDIEHVINISAGEEHTDPELWLDVVNSLQTLSVKEQTVLSLSVMHGYTFTEIAYAMNVSVSTVTRQYQNALEKIKKDLQGVKQTRKKKRNVTDI